MSDVYNPPSRIQSQSHCGSMEEYQRRWRESIDDPYQFWGQIAKEFHWKIEPTKEDFVNYNFNVNDGPIKVGNLHTLDSLIVEEFQIKV